MNEIFQNYAAKNYEKALELLNEQQKDLAPEVYFYNAGLLHLKMNHPGAARGHLEIARQLQPFDLETRKALSQAQTLLWTSKNEKNWNSSSSALEDFSDRFSSDELRGVIGLLAIIQVVIWLHRFSKTRRFLRSLLHPLSISISVVLMFILAFFLIQQSGWIPPAAYVVQESVIREGAGDKYPAILTVLPGTKLRYLHEELASFGEGWYLVRYAPQHQGWVAAKTLIIKPGD